MEKIPLAEMMGALRAELLTAQAQAAGEDLRFKLQDIEVELQFTTTVEGTVKGGVKFWVLDAEAAGKVATQNMHKLKFKLSPQRSDGKDVEIADEDERPA